MALEGVFKPLIVAELATQLWNFGCFSSDSETLQFIPSTQNTSVNGVEAEPTDLRLTGIFNPLKGNFS